MNFQSDICVVGDGAIGKSLALGLSQQGYSVTLLRPPARPPQKTGAWDTRVYALNHAARQLLSGLRVWEAMDANRIAPVEAMLVHGDSARAGHLDFNAWNARSSELAWIVEDSNLEQAMDGALRYAQRLQQVEARATRIVRNLDGVELQLEDGRLIHSRLLVGADGRNSWVRAQCDIGMTYRDYHQQGVVANFECELPHQGKAQQWFSEAKASSPCCPCRAIVYRWSGRRPMRWLNS
jgi:2-polyprenylphenol 6-hydroxylase